MEPNNSRFEGRFAGVLIAAAALTAMLLMLRHPTSADGVDDGRLLRDLSNTTVHGAMMACIFVFMFAFSILALRLDERHLSVRAGRMALVGGMTVLAVASFINAFVIGGLMATLADPSVAGLQFQTFGMAGQALALLGMSLVGVGTMLWAVRMLRLDPVTKFAGALGIALALLATWWLLNGQGVFGLYPATYAMIAFVLWCLVVAAQLIRGKL